jgi:ABC-type transport system involved in multi-copper enzyme maturation permease subunit
MTAVAVSGRTLMLRQILAVQMLEIRKRFLGKRALPVYLLVLIPLVIFAGHTLSVLLFSSGGADSIPRDRVIYAVLFRTLILRFVVYFGCVAVFVPLFRGDILDKSLHYYLLAPVKRSTLTVAKYLSGLAAAVVLFGAVTVATWTLLYVAHGPGALAEQFASGSGFVELGSYLLVTVLACVGYGAVFLAAGVFFRSPIVPAIAILGWELINALLPPVLKKISVIHYLESLCPVSIPPDSGIALLADPASPWVAVPGIVALATVLVVLTARKAARLEVAYGNE